jgi:four helix bundle protein
LNKVKLQSFLGVNTGYSVLHDMEYKPTDFGFEKLSVWHKAKDLALFTYRITKGWPKKETYGLISQLTRAAVSVSANIAEGTSRFSDKEQKRFLEIAYGSNIEVLSHLMVSQGLGYCNDTELAEAKAKILEISKMLSGLMKVKNKNISLNSPL